MRQPPPPMLFCSIQALLSAPNPDDPLAENIAKHWKTNEVEAVATGTQPPPRKRNNVLFTFLPSFLFSHVLAGLCFLCPPCLYFMFVNSSSLLGFSVRHMHFHLHHSRHWFVKKSFSCFRHRWLTPLDGFLFGLQLENGHTRTQQAYKTTFTRIRIASIDFGIIFVLFNSTASTSKTKKSKK